MRHPLYKQLNRIAADRWAWHGVRTMLRAAWISICVWCIGIGASMLLGLPADTELFGALALVVLGGALVLLLLRARMAPVEVARRLDRRFRLDEQLATAVEVAAQAPQPGSIGDQLLDRSTQLIRTVQRRLRQRMGTPWSDLLTLIALALVAVGLFFLAGIGRPATMVESPPLPPLAGVEDPLSELEPENPIENPNQRPIPSDPSAGVTDLEPGLGAEGAIQPGAGGQRAQQPGAQGEGGEMGQGGRQMPIDAADQRALETVADALRDQGVTRPAAEALDQGDVSRAAQELREVADQAGQLSREARNSLSDSLRDAADQIEQTNPQLADQLRQSARGLERGDEYAERALEDLAGAIEDAAQPPGSADGQLLPGEAGQEAQGGQGGGEPGEGGQQPGQAPGASGDDSPGEGAREGGGGGAGNVGAGEQRPIESPERLGVEGQAVQLDVEGVGQSPALPSSQATVAGGGAIGSVSGGGTSSSDGANGPDPLRIPLDERDVVQEYFTP